MNQLNEQCIESLVNTALNESVFLNESVEWMVDLLIKNRIAFLIDLNDDSRLSPSTGSKQQKLHNTE